MKQENIKLNPPYMFAYFFGICVIVFIFTESRLNIITLYSSLWLSFFAFASFYLSKLISRNIYIHLFYSSVMFLAFAIAHKILGAYKLNLTMKGDGNFVYIEGMITKDGIIYQLYYHAPFLLVLCIFVFLWRKISKNKELSGK